MYGGRWVRWHYRITNLFGEELRLRPRAIGVLRGADPLVAIRGVDKIK
jgi:hypothetical protein